jgi:hypothetical protein
LLLPKILRKERKAEKKREKHSRRPDKKSNKIHILKIQRSIGHIQSFNKKVITVTSVQYSTEHSKSDPN